MREMKVPPRLPFTSEGVVRLVITRVANPLTPPMLDHYGFRRPRLNHAAVRLGSALLMNSVTTRVPYGSCPGIASAVGDACFWQDCQARRREAANFAGFVPG